VRRICDWRSRDTNSIFAVPYRFETLTHNKEVIAEFADHIATAHNVFEISDEILVLINKVIREEVRVRTRFAEA
jgi:predicted small metal-binding protein